VYCTPAGINADIQYKNRVYSVAETESALVTDSNYITPVSLGGLFAQTANSTPITGTTVESTLINGGVGSLSVPANGFSVGDSFRGDFGGVLSTANNQTIRIRIKSGSAIFVDSGLQTINNVSNNVWSLSIDFTVRQLGAAGTASIVTLATFNYAKTVNEFNFNTSRAASEDSRWQQSFDLDRPLKTGQKTLQDLQIEAAQLAKRQADRTEAASLTPSDQVTSGYIPNSGPITPSTGTGMSNSVIVGSKFSGTKKPFGTTLTYTNPLTGLPY